MKKKIVVVELYFSCREDVDARKLAGMVMLNTSTHEKMSLMEANLVAPPNDFRDLQFSGHSWKETSAR